MKLQQQQLNIDVHKDKDKDSQCQARIFSPLFPLYLVNEVNTKTANTTKKQGF
jgi:hypothetical protein